MYYIDDRRAIVCPYDLDHRIIYERVIERMKSGLASSFFHRTCLVNAKILIRTKQEEEKRENTEKKKKKKNEMAGHLEEIFSKKMLCHLVAKIWDPGLAAHESFLTAGMP